MVGSRLPASTGARVGLSAVIGPDCPPKAIQWLQCYGVDTEGLTQSSLPTPRAWQLLEADGRRTQVWRTTFEDQELCAAMLRPAPRGMLRQASAYHIGIHPRHFDIDLLRSLKSGQYLGLPDSKDEDVGHTVLHTESKNTPWLSAETFTCADTPISSNRLKELLEVVDIFSPNLLEAESMVGISDPEKVFPLIGPVLLQLACITESSRLITVELFADHRGNVVVRRESNCCQDGC